jgi:hypothetical protein
MMTLLNYALDSGLFLWGGFIAFSGAITWSVVRQAYSNETLINETTDTDVNTIRDSIASSDSFRNFSTETVTPGTFESRILRSIQEDLDRVHSSTSNPIAEAFPNLKITEKTINITDLYDSGNLDQLSNVLWSSANHTSQMSTIIQNSTEIINSNPQLVDLISFL